MKDYIFNMGADEIKETGVNELSGIGRVKISSEDGELIVVCYQIEEGLWRVALTSSGPDKDLPEWRTSYSIGAGGVMPSYILHAPDESILEIVKDDAGA